LFVVVCPLKALKKKARNNKANVHAYTNKNLCLNVNEKKNTNQIKQYFVKDD